MKHMFAALSSLRLWHGIVFALCVAFILPCRSHEIVVEWQREFTPYDPGHPDAWSVSIFNVFADLQNRIFVFGGKSINLFGGERMNPSHNWIAQLSENEDSLVWQRDYGDLEHQFGSRSMLMHAGHFILAGGRADLLETDSLTRLSGRPSLLYLDENFDSVTTVEFAQNCEANLHDIFVNRDGSVDVFVKSYGIAGVPVFYRVSPDYEVIKIKEYERRETEEDLGFLPNSLFIDTPKSRCVNGDYLMLGEAKQEIQDGDEVVTWGGPFVARIDGTSGEFIWHSSLILDSLLYDDRYVQGANADFFTVIEDSVVSCIYTFGKRDISRAGQYCFTISKIGSDGSHIWTREFGHAIQNNWSSSSIFNQVYLLRENLFAVFGYVAYRHGDNRIPGPYIALADTSGNILEECYIEGEHIGIYDKFRSNICRAEPNRFLAQIANIPQTILSVRFNLDPAGSSPSVPVPDKFALYPAYPNPFNSSACIAFSLPQGFAVLSVYDLTGREVSRLVNGSLPAGAHSVTFDARGLATGAYFLRLSSLQGTQTQKLMLVK